MNDAIRKGSICKFDASLQVINVSNELKKAYKRMKRLDAAYYIILRNSREKGLMCVPLLADKCAHYVRVVINGKNYYAESLVCLPALENWFICEKVRIGNPLASVDKIYEMQKAYALHKKEREKKKEEQRGDDKRLRQEMNSLTKSMFPKEEVSSVVSWNMTHPFQGGRTGSK